MTKHLHRSALEQRTDSRQHLASEGWPARSQSGMGTCISMHGRSLVAGQAPPPRLGHDRGPPSVHGRALAADRSPARIDPSKHLPVVREALPETCDIDHEPVLDRDSANRWAPSALPRPYQPQSGAFGRTPGIPPDHLLNLSQGVECRFPLAWSARIPTIN